MIQAAPRLRGWPFPLTFPGPVFGPTRFPQSRHCGVLWSARYPCRYFGPVSAPDSFARRCGNSLAQFASILSDFSGGLMLFASGPFHSHVLDPSSSFLAFLSRDSAASSGLHATPVTVSLRPGSYWISLGLTAPPTLRLSVRLGAFASGFA